MTIDVDKAPVKTMNGFAWREKASVSYLVCEPLERAGFQNAFSSRSGGVSPRPANALNLSRHEDTKENVDENRRRFFNAARLESFDLATVHQIHSARVIPVSMLGEVSPVEPDGDAMVSSLKNILFGIQTADCLPILIGDPESGIMGAIHAGWRGTMDQICKKSFAIMSSLGANPQRCIAALGPLACGECYEVGSDVVQAFRKQFPESISFFKDIKENGKAFLDVQAANLQQLLAIGIPADQIYASSYCTIHDNSLFFSYRSESKGGALPVGRQLSVIGRN